MTSLVSETHAKGFLVPQYLFSLAPPSLIYNAGEKDISAVVVKCIINKIGD